MDLSFIFDFFDNIPFWVWIIVGLWFVFKYFGDVKQWEYEVDFPYLKNVGKGEIEFKSYAKRGLTIEVDLDLAPANRDKESEVFLNNNRIFTLPPEKNSKTRVFTAEAVQVQEPKEGDEVVVKVGGESTLKGMLKRD